METKKPKFTNILDSETFGNNNSQYFIDIKQGHKDNHYLQITNKHNDTETSYRRTHVILFEDDLPFFVEALTMLLSRHATGNHGISC